MLQALSNDLSIFFTYKISPLHAATILGSVPMARKLVERTIEQVQSAGGSLVLLESIIDDVHPSGNTALLYTVLHRHAAVAEILLETQAVNPSSKDNTLIRWTLEWQRGAAAPRDPLAEVQLCTCWTSIPRPEGVLRHERSVQIPAHNKPSSRAAEARGYGSRAPARQGMTREAVDFNACNFTSSTVGVRTHWIRKVGGPQTQSLEAPRIPTSTFVPTAKQVAILPDRIRESCQTANSLQLGSRSIWVPQVTSITRLARSTCQFAAAEGPGRSHSLQVPSRGGNSITAAIGFPRGSTKDLARFIRDIWNCTREYAGEYTYVR